MLSAELFDSNVTLLYETEMENVFGLALQHDFRLDYIPGYLPEWSGDFWFPANIPRLVPGSQRLLFPAGPAELD